MPKLTEARIRRAVEAVKAAGIPIARVSITGDTVEVHVGAPLAESPVIVRKLMEYDDGD